MGKTAAKQHQKVKVQSVVKGPDGKLYPRSDLELVMRYNERGGNPRMFWQHKKSDLSWSKVRGDESFGEYSAA